MNLNTLLYHHQVALIEGAGASSNGARRWAGLSAAFYAGRIVEARAALGHDDPFVWSKPACEAAGRG